MATIITARSESVLHFLNPIAVAHNLWRHRNLIRQFTRREIEVRYRGSYLGLFWSFVNPLVLLLIYTFVFGVVFQARWPNAKNAGLGEFALVLFCGLTAFNIFGETVNRSSAIIHTVPNYVKKVIFPLEVLPVSVLGAAFFHALISLSILLVANIVVSGALQITVLLLPIVALPLVFLSIGIGWFVSSLGVFIRDMGHTIVLIIQVLIFTTPIFYPLAAIPESFRQIIQLNPFTMIVENFRRVILWGTVPEWGNFILWLAITMMIMLLGYAWFMKTKKAFADVI
jgi:lipopolysaccharide transport system permease protein